MMDMRKEQLKREICCMDLVELSLGAAWRWSRDKHHNCIDKIIVTDDKCIAGVQRVGSTLRTDDRHIRGAKTASVQ
jgi:hypothetical protein